MLVAAVLVGVLSAHPWVWPVDGAHTVLRAFDPPVTQYSAGHRGADLPTGVGAPVRAAGAGRVSYAGLLAGRGVVVVVHGDLRTTYEPVAAVVRVGALVAAGQVVGRVTAGDHCGGAPCLHWGLLRGSTYLDPVQLVQRGPSRLLPVDGAAAPPAAQVGVVPAAPGVAPAVAQPAAEPAFSLRADEVPWGAGALLALLAGLALLRPSRRPPHTPVAAALSAPAPSGQPVPAQLVDLVAERARRRA